MIVADSNLIAYLLIEGEHTAIAQKVLAHDSQWAVPPIWRSEFRNVLVTYLRKGALSLSVASRTMRHSEVLLRDKEYSVDSDEVLALAVQSGCTAYDCEFAVLAQELGIKLVTSDRALLNAFPALAISPYFYTP